MKMIKILKLLVFCLLSIWVGASIANDSIGLSDSDQSGSFIQQKHLKVLTRPFVTEGNYAYNKERGLSWQTTMPSKSELSINAQGVFEISSDGNKKLLTNDTRFSQLLLAIFSGDQQQLLAQFNVEIEEDITTLVPLDEQVKTLFKVITLNTSNGEISQIKLDEPNGNTTVILLTANKAEKLQD